MRDDFTRVVTDAIAKRAAYICSNPDGRVLTIAPSDSDESAFLYVGKVAHICAAAPGGPRFDKAMAPGERKDPTNALFLCSTCADLIDKNGGLDFPPERLKGWKLDHERWVFANLNKRKGGRGGDGGDGTIIGARGTVIGGRGGDGGVGGSGGRGGSGFITGDDGLIIGGDGGSSGTPDGRGGRGARSPTERFGFPSAFWGAGRGGSGANAPEYNRRILLLTQVRGEYTAKFPHDAVFIQAGIDQVPVDWVNQRLAELGESWQVDTGPSGHTLPALSASDFDGASN